MSFRLTLSLILGVALVASLFAYFQVKAEKRGLKTDLERRAEVLADSVAESVKPLLAKGSLADLQRLVERFGNRERLAGVAVYDASESAVAITSALSGQLQSRPNAILSATRQNKGQGEFFSMGSRRMHVYVLPLRVPNDPSQVEGTIAIFHDASFIEAQSARFWRTTYLRVLVQTVLIMLITLLIIRWTLVGPITRTARRIRELRTRGTIQTSDLPEEELFKPLMREVAHMAKSLSVARAAAEEEARLRVASDSIWTAERLRIYVQSKLQDSPLFVVSNREPYMHVHQGKGISVMVPASGLVTGLEPILRACAGTWVANGSGDADREMVDADDHLRVPPEDPQYTLRRVWLTKEEEEGYYYGFANEGIWPLCHIAHTRPLFRTSDWKHYRTANERFAKAVLKEMEESAQPQVLVQDYHFALLPQMIKERRPDARVAIFWHIPWPNAEKFGICPWERDLLDGLLGADLIGFHIQAHCNNFLETVDRAMESQVDWERFAVNRRAHLTLVRPFPISVAFNGGISTTEEVQPPEQARAALFKELGVQADLMGIGVDRIDYTKGILERFRGIERFLRRNPAYQGRFTFVQIGAPSRTHIKRYHDFQAEVEAEVERINWDLQRNNWKPILYLSRHHSHQQILPYYRAANLCLVTSLHDGMNLVAKEFAASRDDEQGVLILSRFTGACRELRDALLVNPYDTDQVAEAIRFALEMEPGERRSRMVRIRTELREHNIYRWAANLISELSNIRIENSGDAARSWSHVRALSEAASLPSSADEKINE